MCLKVSSLEEKDVVVVGFDDIVVVVVGFVIVFSFV
jgi:hypothetical protein